MLKSRSHDEAMAQAFLQDPSYAVDYLNAILEDGDQGELLVALRQMTLGFGGMPAIAEKAKLNRTQLYRMLSSNGNPELRSFLALLETLGLRLEVKPVPKAA